MTDECFGAVIALIEAAYGLEFSAERKRAWFLLLADLADDEAQRAVLQVCRTSPHPPRPADIIRAARGSPKDAEALLEEEAEAAIRWLETHLRDDRAVDLGAVLNRLVREFGGPDQIVAQVLDGGWRFRRAEAVRAYKALRRQGVPYEAPEVPEAVRYLEAVRAAQTPQEREAAVGAYRAAREAAGAGPEPIRFPHRDIPGLPAPAAPPLAPVLPA